MEIINLDMTPSTVTPNAHAGQYDSARTVRFMLKNGGVPFTLAGTETITAEITRSDNTEVTVNVANTSSNYVDVVFDDTVCTVKGLYACELRLKDSDGFDIGSKNFALLVQRDPYDGAGIHVETVGPSDICTFETELAEPLVNVKTALAPSLTGYTAVNLTACGVNLWDEQTELGYIKVADGTDGNTNNELRSPSGVYYPIKPSTEYYFVKPVGQMMIFFYDENKAYTGSRQTGAGVFTTPANAYYFRITLGATYGTTYNHDTGINYPSTDTTYHAYTGNTYAIALGDTYYGGTLDVTTGVLTVTMMQKKISDLSWTRRTISGVTGYIFLSNDVTGAKEGQSPILSSCYDIKTNRNYIDGDLQVAISNNTTALDIVVKDDTYTSEADFITGRGNETLLFELATPIEIDLGSGTAVTARAGEVNNVFADTGETELKYLTIEA